MSPSVRRRAARLVTVLAIAGVAPARTRVASAAEDAAPTAQWQAPAAIRSIAWPGVSTEPLELEPSARVELQAGRVTLVPVNAGDQVRISGGRVNVGFGSGTSELYPDAVSWLGPQPASVVRVPTWSSARFLALRAETAESVALEVMARADDPLREHRFDAAVYAWLACKTSAAPEPRSDAERRALATLSALRTLLERAGAHVRPCSPGDGAPSVFLMSHWLELRLLSRRLVEPFFVTEPSSITGGRALAPDDAGEPEDVRDWRLIRAGEQLFVRASNADVVSFAVRARALGQTRVQIWSGKVLLHDLALQVPRRAEGPQRWTPARIARVALRGDRQLRVVALEGEARVAADGHRAERGLLEPETAHRLRALASAWKAAGPAWLDELLAFHLRGTDADVARLVKSVSIMAQSGRMGAASQPDASAAKAAALALIAYDILPALAGDAAFLETLTQFWSTTSALPAASRDALRAGLLERLHATLPEPVAVPGLPPKLAADPAGKPSASRARLEALLESAILSEDGARPRALFELEREVSEHADDAQLVELAHGAWSRAAPWQALAAPGAVERTILRRPFDAHQPSGICENQSERGLRWWIVPSEPTSFEVLDLGGTHASVRLLPLHADATLGSEVLIGDRAVRVQPALGEESRVALRPGAHRIQHRSGGAVIARIPRLGSMPCDQLVEMERWFSLRGELVFSLPEGDAPTVASVIVDPSSLPKAGGWLDVTVGDATVSGWFRSPASGDIEIVVPPGATELRVRSEQVLLVRARARMHPSAEALLGSIPPRQLQSVAASLTELSELTARLRRPLPADESRGLRRRRAELLLELGYPELAALDDLRAGEPETDRPRLPGALFLPEHPEPVVPLGVAARAPLLPLRAPETVERALAFDRLGQSERASRELVGERLHEGTDVGALLAARLASQTGNHELGAEIFARLAQATGSGALFEAAAEEYDRLALGTGRIDAAEHAFTSAKLAAQAGTRMDALFARYATAVEWIAPSLSALGVGARNVDVQPRIGEDEPLGSRVRRALMSTPPDARQFGSETSFNVRRWRGQTLIVESLCFNREGPDEDCDAEVLVDGVLQRCPRQPRETQLSLATRDVCHVALLDGASSLVIRLPAGARRMGWARLARQVAGVDGAAMAPIVWQQTLAAIASDTPVRLDLVGPTVFRVSARALGGTAAVLEIFDRAADPASATPGEPQRVARLDFSAAGAETLAAGGLGNNPSERVSEPRELEYVVAAPGVHQLTLLATSGRLLVRPEIASVVKLPEPASDSAEPVEAAPSKAPATAPFDLGLTGVASYRTEPPLSLSAELSLQGRDLADSEEDAGDRYAQTALVLRRGFFSEQLWVAAAAFSRFRDGAPSAGAELASGSAVDGLRPGAFATVRMVTQPAFDAFGANATFGVRQRVSLGPRASLLPELGATWRRNTASASVHPDVDVDVYSAYAVQRPWSIDAKAVLAHRPFLDAFGRHTLGVRVIPDVGGVDRIDAQSEFDLIAGSGWTPWLGLGLGVSHRPSFDLRQHAFTRWQLAPRATFWQWLSRGSRLRSDLDVSVFLDTPNPSGTRAGVSASLVLGYDFLLGAGLADYRPSDRPFRARLEEGGPAPAPVPPANDVYWREEEQP